jgi:O-antigen/teichoic acid export membrane protein
LIVPLIVLNRIGPSGVAYYYVSFQLATLLWQAAYSVQDSFLVEGAANGAITKALLMRSSRILIALCVPSLIGVILFGRQLLSAFGAEYGSNAESTLFPLMFSIIPIAIYHWCLVVLQLSNQLRAIVWTNAVYAAAIIGFAFVLAPRGLGGVTMGWPLGTTVAALVGGVVAIRSMRRTASTRPNRVGNRS